MDMGTLSKAEIRQKWAAGEYRGVKPEWAKGYMEDG